MDSNILEWLEIAIKLRTKFDKNLSLLSLSVKQCLFHGIAAFYNYLTARCPIIDARHINVHFLLNAHKNHSQTNLPNLSSNTHYPVMNQNCTMINKTFITRLHGKWRTDCLSCRHKILILFLKRWICWYFWNFFSQCLRTH